MNASLNSIISPTNLQNILNKPITPAALQIIEAIEVAVQAGMLGSQALDAERELRRAFTEGQHKKYNTLDSLNTDASFAVSLAAFYAGVIVGQTMGTAPDCPVGSADIP